jgi:predicted O-methyltransferase YrrM
MDQAVAQVLAEYDARAERERGFFRGPPRDLELSRDQLLLRVGPETGQLINILAREAEAKSILELGTSYGYSTVWLADAARQTGGRVTSLDLVADKQTYAKSMLQKCGLDGFVHFMAGDATKILSGLSGRFDFVLVDLWKELYVACFDLLYPAKLKDGALLVADNMLQPQSSRPDANAYRRRVRSAKGMESVLLAVGSGIEISRYAPNEQLD